MWSTGNKYFYHGQVVRSAVKLPQAVSRIEYIFARLDHGM